MVRVARSTTRYFTKNSNVLEPPEAVTRPKTSCERDRRPVQPSQRGARVRIRREQRRNDRLAGDADRGCESVSGGRPRTSQRHVHGVVGARAGSRVKNVVIASTRVECRAVPTRYGERHVLEFDDAVDAPSVTTV